MRKTIVSLVLLSCAYYCGAEETLTQYEGFITYSLLQSHQYVDPDGSDGFLFNSKFNSTRIFSENLSLQFDHHFRGVNSSSLYPEDFYPNQNCMSAGILLSGFGNLQATYSNTLFPGAQTFPVPYYQAGTETQSQMLNTVDGSWKIEKEWFHLSSEATTFIYNFRLKPADRYLSQAEAESPPYGDKRDVDLWAQISSGVDLPVDISVDVGTFIKNDLNGYDHYNIDMYWFGLAGEPQLKPNRLMLSWEVNEQYWQSKMMKESGYSTGLATDIMMRLLWRKSSELFIKGEIDVDVADQLFKQYYEFQLRKSWNRTSSFDIVYFATNGVLFPRQGLNLASALRLFDHFGFAPSASVYLSRLPSESEFRYYRSDVKLELLFPIRNRIELFSGAGYSNYDHHPLFSSRSSFFAGLRTW
jgi:hypothetical protein